MTELEKEISKVFLMKENTMMSLMDEGCSSYLARSNNLFSIAIPYNGDIEINQDFVGMHIRKTFINYGGNSISSLSLSAYDTVDPLKFSLISSDFASAKNRRTLLTNPYEWIDKWRSLFGDALKKKMVYDVLGELITLKTLFEIDKSLTWMGPEKGTHDIVGDNVIYEVKTTVKKTEYIVSINSSYQISKTKPTNLIFVRLERKPYCQSINSVVKELIELGYKEETIEKELNEIGYPKGDRTRDESYDLLSLLLYPIEIETFPLFTIEQINEFAPKKNIISYSIGLDLKCIDHMTLFEKK